MPNLSEIEQSAAELQRSTHWKFGAILQCEFDQKWIFTIYCTRGATAHLLTKFQQNL